MKKSTNTLSTVAVVLMLLGTASAPVVAEEGDPIMVSEIYEVHYLRGGMAELLARQHCGALGHKWCRWSAGPQGLMQFMAPQDIQDKFARSLEKMDVPPATQVFQIHLLRAENADPRVRDEPTEALRLPPDAMEALMDLKTILPYERYRNIDSAIMRTSGEGKTYLGQTTRYEASLRFDGDPTGDKPLLIGFELTAEYVNRVGGMPIEQEGGRHGLPGRTPVKIESITELQVIATRFSMKVGETVVVGTSKLSGGDTALILLLTATR
jgi:hypothetical protein